MNGPDVQLLDGEHLISDGNELTYRQVTKHLISGDRVATTAFGPASADRGMPSFSRGSIVTAQAARDWHTENAQSPSLGVWAVSVTEAIDAGRYIVDDSNAPIAIGEKRAPGHCFVDYRGLSKRVERELRSKLYWAAMARGEIATTATTVDGELFA